MNKDNAKDFLPLVQALADGKTLEYMYAGSNKWTKALNVSFTAEPCRYRIKPEPREFWITITPNGIYYTFSTESAAKEWRNNGGGTVVHVVEQV